MLAVRPHFQCGSLQHCHHSCDRFLDSGDSSDHRVSCGYASELIHRSPLSIVVFAETLLSHDMTNNYVSATATCYAATTPFAQSPDEVSPRFPKKNGGGASTWPMEPRHGRKHTFPNDPAEVHREHQTAIKTPTRTLIPTRIHTFQSTHGLRCHMGLAVTWT